jgi:hypothetical protein
MRFFVSCKTFGPASLEKCLECGVAIVACWKAVEQHIVEHGDDKSARLLAALEK